VASVAPLLIILSYSLWKLPRVVGFHLLGKIFPLKPPHLDYSPSQFFRTHRALGPFTVPCGRDATLEDLPPLIFCREFYTDDFPLGDARFEGMSSLFLRLSSPLPREASYLLPRRRTQDLRSLTFSSDDFLASPFILVTSFFPVVLPQ